MHGLPQHLSALARSPVTNPATSEPVKVTLPLASVHYNMIFMSGGSWDSGEIGDLCNAVDGPLNGVSVESYWSMYDGACLIPTAWSVRRTLAGAGKKLNGQGIRSLQNPIDSLNRFIVNP
jgi:hypothetical protein